jgi:hypothetical protein
MAAGNTYTEIVSQTLGSATASVTFSSIPSTYTDLVVVCAVFNSADGAGTEFQFNSDTGTNYSNTFLEGSGSTATSSRESNQSSIQMSFNVGGNSTNPCITVANIQNYSNSTTNKTLLGRWNSASGGTYPGTSAAVGLWRNTSAITSVLIRTGSGNFNTGSTFSLYGIASA